MIDWNTYATTYPERYFRRSYFDECIESVAKYLTKWDYVLEIGSNTYGIKALQDRSRKFKYHTYDKWVKNQPGEVTYNTWSKIPKNTFTLIVIRNTINYLSDKQLRELSGLLCPEGTLVANSFAMVTQPIYRTASVQSIDGEALMEVQETYNKNTIKHSIIDPDTKEVIGSHLIRNLSTECFNNYLPGCKITQYGKSSILIEFTNPNKRASLGQL